MRGALVVLGGTALGGLIGGVGAANYPLPPEDEAYRGVAIVLYAVLGAFLGAVVFGAIVWAIWLDRAHARRRRSG
jgi:hypothetical protein